MNGLVLRIGYPYCPDFGLISFIHIKVSKKMYKIFKLKNLVQKPAAKIKGILFLHFFR